MNSSITKKNLKVKTVAIIESFLFSIKFWLIKKDLYHSKYKNTKNEDVKKENNCI